MGNNFLVGGFALPTASTPTPPFIRDVDNGKRHAQKRSFAIARALSDQLVSVGLSETALWDWVKACHGVQSRSELSELQYVVLSARLSSAQNSPVLFDEMSRQIKLYVSRITGTRQCRVLRANLDGTYKTLYDGSFSDDIHTRAKRHADASGLLVSILLPDGGVKSYHPLQYAHDPECPPIGEYRAERPARAFEMKQRDNETHRVEIEFPNTQNVCLWGQRRADETGNDVVITDRAGHSVLMQFDCKK